MTYEDVLVYLKDAYMKMVVNLKYGLKKYGLRIILISYKGVMVKRLCLTMPGRKATCLRLWRSWLLISKHKYDRIKLYLRNSNFINYCREM